MDLPYVSPDSVAAAVYSTRPGNGNIYSGCLEIVKPELSGDTRFDVTIVTLLLETPDVP